MRVRGRKCRIGRIRDRRWVCVFRGVCVPGGDRRRRSDCTGSKSAVERDVARMGKKAKILHSEAPGMRVRASGVDGTGAKTAGQRAGILFFVDVDRGKLVSVEAVDEKDSRSVRRHVQRVMHEAGAEQLRTDELSVYERIVDQDDHNSSDESDRTNNSTERITGLDYKIRARTMRGFKSWSKALAHCYLSEFLRGEDGGCDLRRVV